MMSASNTDLSNFIIFQNLVSNLPMIFYALDENWIFTLSDGKGLENLGLKPGQVVGANAKEMYIDHPDIITAIEKAYQGNSVRYEHQLGDLYIENFVMPVFSSQGKVEGIIGATIDITERKKAELNLLKTQELQQAIFDSVPGMLYLYDAKGELNLWNKAHEAITGYTHEELDHFNLANWYKDDPESLQAVTVGLSVAEKNGYGEAEANLQRKDGTKIPFYFTACPVEIDHEHYFVGIGIDISKQKKAEEELISFNKTLEDKVVLRTNELHVANKELTHANEELTAVNEEMFAMNEELTATNEEMTAMNEELTESNNKIMQMKNYLVESEKMAALGGLVAGVAHEVNTPLGVGITASSHLVDISKELMLKIAEPSYDKDEILDYLEDIQKASSIIEKNLTRAGKLTQSFKQLSVDQTSEPKRLFNVGDYLEEILITLSPTLKKTNIHIKTECEEKLFISGSPGAFAQIITNLVMNSLHHAYESKDQGLITIKLQNIDSQIKLVFSDDGCGMNTHTRSKIYEPFFTTRRDLGGTGLGLSVVYSIVTQQFSGTIECSSELGVGTTFTILLSQGGDR
ncbi:PAS domain S-box protein [Fusibacter bizertensis]|uniref:histidine kinase n=1 Tax=Fusibacter bizertensis TaxID=1488331 RepID=A0ABT6NFT2_9FIRM|nr:PAS domain S-box protein [Fusibacter bizertensis]MDH8679293.1 PAS domain S-box protein [Fusibacter bizertensis]